MNLLDKSIAVFSPQRALSRVRARAQIKMLDAQNGYDAAGKGRRNTWTRGSDTSANAEIRSGLPLLRARSRELVRNNPYAAAAVRVITTNTVGTGIRPYATGNAKKRVETAQREMNLWASNTLADYDGLHTLYGMEALAMRTLAESGEALIVRQFKRTPGLRVPLRLRVLEGDYLDHNKNERRANGEQTIQGVVFSRDGERKGYWLFDQHPGERSGALTTSRFVSADQVIHLFEVLRPGQVRGIPRGVAAFMRMKALDDFQDARLEQMKVAACFGGVIKNENEDAKGGLLPERLEPGMFPELGYGQDVIFNNPPAVSGHAEYVNEEQRAIAIAYGVSYESLTGNLRQVNYSSGRIGWLEFQRNIDQWRGTLLIPRLCGRIAQWWSEAAMLAGIDTTGVEWGWTPPRRELQDPTREIPAMILAARAGYESLFDQIRSRGGDPEQVMDEIKKLIDLLDKNGFTLDTDPRQPGNGQRQQDDGEDDPVVEAAMALLKGMDSEKA